jgi:hypothetical protein
VSWANDDKYPIVDASHKAGTAGSAVPGDEDGRIAIVSTFALDGVEHTVIGSDAGEVRRILAPYIAAARLLDC